MLFLSEKKFPTAANGRIDSSTVPVVVWLLTCCALVFAMVILGGVTRLTGSGLSMVDWQPIKGVIPPLSEAQWQAVFDDYKMFPEFRFVNKDMDLTGFKFIFLFEYGHRVLGRVIGMVFLLPMLWFLWQKRLSPALRPHLLTMFVLGGLQGLLGWYMVKSGLVNDPHVSQYRLTAHLCLAVAIYGYMLFVALELMHGDATTFMRKQGHHSFMPAGLVVLVFLMIASGGFVAGTHAGFIYNTFPDMHGQWFPDGLLALSPAWMNALANPLTIQFNHRWLAYLVFVLVLFHRIQVGRTGLQDLKGPANILVALVLLQVTLGVMTLLYQVPVVLGAAHQGGALLVFSAAVYQYQNSRRMV